MVTIVRRSTWGARRAPGPRTRPLPAKRAYLHHSAGTYVGPEATEAQERAVMRELEEIGHQRFGAAGYGISYTYVVFPSGRAYEGHPVEYLGAHTSGHNTQGVGICWPGNYMDRKGTPAQVATTAALLVDARRRGHLSTYQLAGGHRDTFATACPGDRAYAQVGDVNAQARWLYAQGAKPPAVKAPKAPNGIYTVRKGDTLGGIAGRAKTSVAALVLLNGLPNADRIEVGQRLYTRWVVGRGQTLGAIAARAGTTVDRLVKLNGIRNPDRIEVGQLLRLP